MARRNDNVIVDALEALANMMGQVQHNQKAEDGEARHLNNF